MKINKWCSVTKVNHPFREDSSLEWMVFCGGEKDAQFTQQHKKSLFNQERDSCFFLFIRFSDRVQYRPVILTDKPYAFNYKLDAES